MKKINNIFNHSKGVVSELQYVGENPKDKNYSIWINDFGDFIEVFNDDLKTKLYYSYSKHDMKVRAFKWHQGQSLIFNNWLENNSK